MNLSEVKTDTLKLKAKLSFIENTKLCPSQKAIETDNIEISKEENPDKQFLQVISKVATQKWYYLVDLKVKHFSFRGVTLLDSGVDLIALKELYLLDIVYNQIKIYVVQVELHRMYLTNLKRDISVIRIIVLKIFSW